MKLNHILIFRWIFRIQTETGMLLQKVNRNANRITTDCWCCAIACVHCSSLRTGE